MKLEPRGLDYNQTNQSRGYCYYSLWSHCFLECNPQANKEEQKISKPKFLSSVHWSKLIDSDISVLVQKLLDMSEFLSKTGVYTTSPGSVDVMCLVNTSTGSPGTIMATFISEKQVSIPLFIQL